MRRRHFITLLGGVTAWPLTAAAQQPTMPVIGYLSGYSPDEFAQNTLVAFRQGLAEAGFVEGRNVAIEYRWAEGHYDQLPAMAADLVRLKVSVIVSSGTTTTAAAKAATTTIPIVFSLGADPVESGVVARLARPGGNLTGAARLNTELAPKRLELVHEVVPTATKIALLVNPTNPLMSVPVTNATEAAARTLGLQLHVLRASNEREIDEAFATVPQVRASALVICPDALFSSRMTQLGALTVRYQVPTIYTYRDFAAAGGLMAYGGDFADSHRLAGVYAGRILKGEKPADLPVQQSTKVELYINLKTAKALGLTVPAELLLRATEVIE